MYIDLLSVVNSDYPYHTTGVKKWQGATGERAWKKQTDVKTAALDMTGTAVLSIDLL